MRNVNTISKSGYLEWNLSLDFFAYILYRFWCFNVIYGVSVFCSKVILLLLTITLIPLGVLITQKKRRNYISLMANVVLPSEIYTLAALYRYLSIFNIIIISVSALLSVAYFIIVLARKIKS